MRSSLARGREAYAARQANKSSVRMKIPELAQTFSACAGSFREALASLPK
jgi:hypothetical protein